MTLRAELEKLVEEMRHIPIWPGVPLSIEGAADKLSALLAAHETEPDEDLEELANLRFVLSQIDGAPPAADLEDDELRHRYDELQQLASEALYPSESHEQRSEQATRERRRLKSGSPEHVALWDAINRYAEACGGKTAGGPGSALGSTHRHLAVVNVEGAIQRAIDAAERSGE